ncbi:hypothetical protein [Acinetobacter higginsii]|uniref:hypothetical protein n=1 Tax=Acinetobacter higginsii TaxID=70347 RepID=UPI001F4AC5D9|nr:hypothetical protein [Acinetobacter higginsii]MCH7294111.1 hypothetical protein [Acinetobacter higginsii]
MDLCVVDWKAITPIIAASIAACIASFTAFKISNRWSNQKGSEVIANEAKEAIYQINELSKFYQQYLNNFNPQNLDILLNEHQLIFKDLIHKIDFIFNTPINRDDRKILLEVALNLNKYNILCIGKLDSNKTHAELEELLLRAFNDFSVQKKILIKLLMDYALFKK